MSRINFIVNFAIFDSVRGFLGFIILLLTFNIKAQDKLYFKNGECKSGKVIEIRFDSIFYYNNGKSLEGVSTRELLLLEFPNGKFEVINSPENNVYYHPESFQVRPKSQKSVKPIHLNQISINTLALCNADLSIFYEYIASNKKLGLGLMGAYNFNLYVIPPNGYMYILNNAKKLYDLGAFVNYYPWGLGKKKQIFFGTFFKYTPFNFSSIYTDPVTSAVTFTPAKGYELATMFSIGSHRDINKSLFIKTYASLGGFFLKGAFKQQFNYIINEASTNPNQSPADETNFLLKLYVGINIGMNL